jgi:hypothetical protein
MTSSLEPMGILADSGNRFVLTIILQSLSHLADDPEAEGRKRSELVTL